MSTERSTHRSDADALSLLVSAMGHVSNRDCDKARLELIEARQFVVRSKAKQSVEDAIAACDVDDPQGVWAKCRIATTQLTWAFPPDPITLPIPPDSRAADCACGAHLWIGQPFCASCGRKMSE